MFLLDSNVIYGACMNHTCFCKIEIEPLTNRNNLAKTSLPYIFHLHAFVKFSFVNIIELANFLCFYQNGDKIRRFEDFRAKNAFMRFSQNGKNLSYMF